MAGEDEARKKPGDDYDVGYGKPPKHTQFKPGQSGNPKGRPKRTKNLKTDLMEELSEMIAVREGGRSQFVSKQRGWVKRLVSRALEGDIRALNTLSALSMRLLDTGEGDLAASDSLSVDDEIILREFEERVRRRAAIADAHGTDATDGSEPTP